MPDILKQAQEEMIDLEELQALVDDAIKKRNLLHMQLVCLTEAIRIWRYRYEQNKD